MLTDVVRSSAYTRTEHSTRKVPWTNSTSREQRAGDFDGSRFTPSVYEAAAKQLLPSLSLHTLPRRHSARGRYLGQASPRDKKRAGFLDVSRTQGTPKGTLHAANYQVLRHSFRRPRPRLELCPPNALHRTVSYRMCSREPR